MPGTVPATVPVTDGGPGAAQPWWQSAAIYQIYPRSFCDTTGNGIGDLAGARRHLDHLQWLGVDAIWLSPIYVSPMADGGYDVADYCDVDPLFGSLGDFDELLASAHELGLRVLLDWVPNHSSDQHPWFLESQSSRESAKREWYYWRDGSGPGRPPNNWPNMFLGGPAWTWHPATRQWYLSTFLPQQADLNWSNPEVVRAMHDTLRFWLDRGVDGFRVDVAHLIGKDPALPDQPPGDHSHDPGQHWFTHELLRDLRRLLDEYPGDRLMVGEVFIPSTARVAEFYGHDDELHLAFNFTSLFAPWESAAWRTRIRRVAEELEPRSAWPTWVLSNHDTSRHRTRYGSEARARAAAVLLLTLRGTPFLYAGEELGLEDAAIGPGEARDPGGRDSCRAPIPWTSEPDHGWAAAPWLPWPPEPDRRAAAAEQADPASVAHLYRRLLAVRKASAALHGGALTLLDTPDGVLGFERHAEGDDRTVLVNFTGAAVTVPIDDEHTVEVSSDGSGEHGPYRGTLGPDQALVLRPATN